ncbi:CAF17-like 4Fe-4S cluster assembly/insertion protein YgfZ [Aurantiacibacter poecillastricola]|uniref:CAF17-like 4Fe-4S cluster assembly/insertion protein YgfZ n=1 Tax=Aurantiacibacter poecillastricola TaxID=3064385 RepID=UPI00273E1E59|nr:folate-binding protein [Aurantiacibacter sp. 219JJ12-13]MDP5261497.1 folate-binding protein [Aurantiacibacter sp. 219JJ12-13]
MADSRLISRAVVRLASPDGSEDPAAFLQGLLTNDVKGDLPAYAALLTAQGKTMFDMIVWREGEDLLLDCEAALADDLVKRLSLYRLRRKIDIAVDETVAVHWQAEPRDGASPDPRLSGLGWRWLGNADNESGSADDAWRAHRLASGVPEGQAELGDILWLETNAIELNGVSFSKGCYIGQENTARMNWRQKVNRRLIVVPLGRSDEKRRKAAHEDLGLAIDHLRVSDIPADLAPDWLELTQAE